MCAFANETRNNRLGKTSRNSLRGSIVETAIANVVSVFKENLRPDPTTDAFGTRILPLRRQLRGYKDQDLPPKRQCCLPLTVFKTMSKNANTKPKQAISELAHGALAFAMRSCEYSSVDRLNDENSRKTKLLCIRNIRFFKGISEIRRDCHRLTELADSVQVTFEYQKNRTKFESIAMRKIDGSTCPVKTWASIVQRVLSYPRGNTDSPVNLLRVGRQYRQITATEIRDTLRETVKTLGESNLGIKSCDIGTHSIRSTFAMLLHTHGIEKTTIMKLGRWKSDAVISYIRANVAGFGKHASLALQSDPGSDFANFPRFQPPLNQNTRTSKPTTPNQTITPDDHGIAQDSTLNSNRYNLRRRF